MTEPQTATGLTLLGVYAHPDDEQGITGIFTRAVQMGAKAYVLCATNGQAGQISDPSFATPDTLGDVRRQELKNAVSMLGWEPPILLFYQDGKLNQLPEGELADNVLRVIRDIRADIVVTFERTGGYGHVDHIAIHHATNRAVELAPDVDYRPELGKPHQVKKFYYNVFPKSAMTRFLAEIGDEADIGGDQRTIAHEEMGTPDELITTIIDVRDLSDLSRESLEQHRTQYSPEGMAEWRERGERVGLFGRTHLQRVFPAPAPGVSLPDESDILSGLIP